MKKQLTLILTIFLSFTIGANAQNFNTPQTLDATGDVGWSTQLVVINGNPATTYYDVTNGDLKYIRANDAAGTSWATPVTVASNGNVGNYSSLALVNGYPAISYYDVTNGDLKYVRATNTSGSTWGTPITLASAGDQGKFCFMLIVNSNPAVCYYDVTNGDLKYIRSTDVNGTSWSSAVSVSTTNDVGQYCSMEIVSGNPAIAFWDVTNADVKYVRANDASGTTWGTVYTPVSTGTVGQWTNIIVTNGNPAICYYDATNGDLGYVRATNATGTTWGSPVAAVSTGDVGSYCWMILLNGYPAIAYFDVTNTKIAFVNALDVNGATWASPILPDYTSARNGEFVPSMCAVNGYPAIAYYDGTNADLKYINLCNTWTGGTSTAWTTASNWCFGKVPTTTETISIPNTTNDPIVSASTTVGNMIIGSGAAITLSGSGYTFTASGTVSNSGTISIGSATLSLGGAVSGAGTITGGATSSLNITGAVGTLNFTTGAQTLQNLTLSSTGSATLGTALDIDPVGVVTVTSGGVLTTGGNLTLKSTSAGTARVAAGSSAGGYISGNVTVERYIPGGRRAFRFIAHPFSSSIGLSQLTDDIDITGSNGPTNGFDYQPNNPASAFWYNPVTGNGSTTNDIGWTAFTNTNGTGANSWDKCEAVRVLVRGSKGQGIYAGTYTPNAVTLDMTGPLNQGDVTINLTKGANTPFQLIGNPFQSPINVLLTTRTSLGANVIVWDANQGTKGGYTAWSILSGVIIPPGASFVTTVLTNGSITFPEACKTSSTPLSLLKGTASKPYGVQLRIEDSTHFWDRVIVAFDDSTKESVDYYDQTKIYNPEVSVYTFSETDTMLAIDNRPYVDSQVIRMGMYVPYQQSYKMVAADFNMQLGTKLYLHDKYMNTVQEITSGFEYWFTVNSDTASTGNNRFELNMVGKPTKVPNPTTVATSKKQEQQKQSLEVKLIPNPATDKVTVSYTGADNGEVEIILTNMIGEKISSIKAQATAKGSVSLPIHNVPAGMYLVEVRNGDMSTTQKLIKQ